MISISGPDLQTDLAVSGKNDKIIEDEKFEHEAVHEVENVENIEIQNVFFTNNVLDVKYLVIYMSIHIMT